MTTDSPELEAARDGVDEAIRRFVQVRAREAGISDDPIVVAWAALAEYTSIDMHRDDQSGNALIVPDGQHATASRGCFEFGADAFSRGPM